MKIQQFRPPLSIVVVVQGTKSRFLIVPKVKVPRYDYCTPKNVGIDAVLAVT